MPKQKILDLILREVKKISSEPEKINEFTSLSELNFSYDDFSYLASKLPKVLKDEGIISLANRFNEATLEDLADYITYIAVKK